MRNNKLLKELLPIAVLLVFILVVLILCAVSAGKKKAQEEAEIAAAEEVMADADALEAFSGDETGGGDPGEADAAAEENTAEDADGTESISAAAETAVDELSGQNEPLTEIQRTIELDEVVDDQAELVAEGGADVLAQEAAEQEEVQAKQAAEAKISAGTVSSNTTAVVVVKKTNMEMLAEMMDYWSKGNIEAVEDLSGLAHYRAMSASLKSPSYFYYYGERNADGKPEGKGIAVYGSDQYYYGDWKNGMREGDGMWIRMYYEGGFTVAGVNTFLNSEKNTDATRKASGFSVEPDPALISHRYRGSWSMDLPNGEGHEQYLVDVTQAEKDTRYLQNVMGNFKNGLYDGSMYLITIEWNGNTKEWNGKASQGVFETFETRDSRGNVPICQDKQNSDSHLWVNPLDNINVGITELRAQIQNRVTVQSD